MKEAMRERFLIMVLFTVLVAGGTGFFSVFVVTPTYEATTTLVVRQNNGLEEYSSGDLKTSTYSELIKSRRITEQVIGNLGLEISYEQLIKQVSLIQVENTEVLKITVQSTDREQAEAIAVAYTDVLTSEIRTMGNGADVIIIDEAKAGENAVKPNVVVNVVLGLVVGLMVGVLLVFILGYFDNSIRTKRDVQRYLNLPVLSSIPSMDK